MKLSLGFSPCPNDTFIFDALVHQKVDTEGLEFDVILADVEELNQKAVQGVLDITKLSYHAYAHLTNQYILLDAGSALGRNCGPLLIAKRPLSAEEIKKGPIAIPGKLTTANFLLSLAYPEAQNKQEFLFSDIEKAVQQEEVIAGLIIHENRFTYQDKGLVKIQDLGEFWESSTGHPIPLGGIVAHRRLATDIQHKINRVMARSVAYAQQHPLATRDYVSAHAQEMNEEVMYAHIGLYVNDYTRDLGTEGRAAIAALFQKAEALNVVPAIKEEIFLNK
ncbi:1,4-dihydroxy-6-naphthoate synthase [Lewinella cohaerens]|uniref:1,4-dihydroxy-6-naphthoate synthase n=1 Tax=Lewinella cohaerens TaxID=70995 RepID=UPI00037B9225|nr:1,4-dihydroxy-6-naphthoate synthase [Lewinella cohaerens]